MTSEAPRHEAHTARPARNPDAPSSQASRTAPGKSASVADVSATTVELDVTALPAIQIPGTPGWLTGEPLREQGIEVHMPNLPQDLPVPDLDGVRCRCRVEVIGPRVVRLTIAPSGARVFREPAGWLGIVTEPRAGSMAPTIEVSPDEVRIGSAGPDLTIGLQPFRLLLGDPQAPALRTAERLRQVAGFPMSPPVRLRRDGDDRPHVVFDLELGIDEQILGFGEQFSRVVKNGQRLTLRAEDALGTGTGLAYKPAPVWHSTAGYLGFLNTGATVEADVGHALPSVLSLDVADEALDLYVFGAPSPTERLADYTVLTGRGRRPPIWAFGYWMGRCRYHSAEEMLDVADGMRSRRVPIDVLHVDYTAVVPAIA